MTEDSWSDSSAVICDGPGLARVGTLERIALRANEVMIRTLYSGVSSGTDKWVMQGRFGWRESHYPLVPGYQRSGIVEAVGSATTKFRVGQLVSSTTATGFDGASSQWGSHVALAASPESEVFDATGVNPIAAALFVSAQVGANAASRVTVDRGSRILVIGAGIIGSSAALSAAALGFEVMVLDHHDRRLAALAALGIATQNNASGSMGDARVWHPATVIDTAQSDEAFNQYVELLPARAGEVVFSGHSPDGTKWWADMKLMQQREITAHFVSGWTPERLTSTLESMRAGQFPIEKLVGTIALDESSVAELVANTLEGSLQPVAATIDWRSTRVQQSHSSARVGQ